MVAAQEQSTRKMVREWRRGTQADTHGTSAGDRCRIHPLDRPWGSRARRSERQVEEF